MPQFWALRHTASRYDHNSLGRPKPGLDNLAQSGGRVPQTRRFTTMQNGREATVMSRASRFKDRRGRLCAAYQLTGHLSRISSFRWSCWRWRVFETSAMTCNECQQPITEEQKTCPNCGAPVEPQSSARGTEAFALKRFISSALQKLMPKSWFTIGRFYLLLVAGGAAVLMVSVVDYLARPSEVNSLVSLALHTIFDKAEVPNKELTVEDVVKAKSGLVVPLEITWTETSLLIFTAKKSAKGSAVIIGTKGDTVLFATNRHVVEVPKNAENIERHVVNGDKRHPFTLASQLTDDLDLALITVRVLEQFSTNTIPSAALNDVVVGEECVAIGNTLGHGISVTTGIISKFDSMASFYANAHDSLVLIRTSAPISPGNSGGALFRRKDGKLLGITTGHLKGGQNVNFVLPVEYLWKLKLLESSTK